jgi:choline-sulfatase
LTGTYPDFHGVTDFGIPLPAEVPDLPSILQRHGYATAAFVGAIVLDPRIMAPGLDRGFDEYDAGYQLRRPGGNRYKTMERRADKVVSHALAWLGKNSRRPFFVWIHLYDPHDPYDPPTAYARRFKSEKYDGEIAYADAALGRFFSVLRINRLLDGSVVAFMSDHGEALGQHGEGTHGIFLYDETVRVPLFVKLPRGRSAGARISEKVQLVDVAPTLLELAQIPVPKAMQGESLLARLQNHEDRPALSETNYPQRAFGWSPLTALRRDKFLYVQAPRRELYDTRADPQQSRNLAARSPAVVDTLNAELDGLRKRYGRTAEGPTPAPDPAQAQTLAALGYIGNLGQGSKPTASRIDPKDTISIANDLHDAVLANETDHPEQAVASLERVLKRDPDSYVAQLELGTALSRLRRYPAAIPHLERATQLMPDSGVASMELGLAKFQSGDRKGAARPLENSVKAMPRSADAQFSLAAVYARIDRVPEAIEHLKTTLELQPDHYRGNLLLGRILCLQGDPTAGVPNLEEAVTANPESREAHMFLADGYQQLGMLDKAERERTAAKDLPASSTPP